MSKKWFVPKKYGWGFVPVSWQGWLMTLLFLITMLGAAWVDGVFIIDQVEPGEMWSIYVRFVIDLLLLVAAFSYFAEKKTKGKVRWNWGKR